MPEEKNFFCGTLRFRFPSFRCFRRLVKLLYVIAIVCGGIMVVARVVLGYQQSPADGLINLVVESYRSSSGYSSRERCLSWPC